MTVRSIGRIRRRPLVVLLALASVLVGCQSGSAEPTNGEFVSGEPTTRIVVGATATSNEPAVDLTDDVIAPIREAVGRGTVQLTAFIGSASGQPVLNKDVSVYYDKAAGETATDLGALDAGFKHNMGPVREKLGAAAGTQPDLDLLGLLGRLAHTPSPATLLVFSSGLQTTGLLDLRGSGSELDVAATVDRVPEDRLPDLTGKKVVFVGLGDVAGPQARLTEKMRANVRELWIKVCEKAHGDCHPEVRKATGGTPGATAPVPTIPVPPEESVVVSDDVTTVTLPSGALFVPGETDFLPEAPAILNGVVHYFLPRADSIPTGATAVGHAATWGDKAGAVETSRGRARKVVEFLDDAGVDPALFTHVDGVGFDEPLVVDLDASGNLIPEAAEQNRTVVLTVTRRSRS